MKLGLVAVLLLLTAAHSQAAVLYELDPEIRRMTEQVLREKNMDYRGEALKRLQEKGERFDRARIEVHGVMSSDDTRDFDHDDFDGQIMPSFSADGQDGIGAKMRSWLGRAREPYTKKDIEQLKMVMRGEMNQRVAMAMAPYRGMEINEIVAHSWGSELIYAAILNGVIHPPKKLIVVGVPDNDMAKWRMLAERTGTEVHWARADNDAVALDLGVKLAKDEAGNVDFEAKWDALCARDNEGSFCHAHDRESKPMIVEAVGNLPVTVTDPTGHARQKYYDLLKRTRVIDGTLLQLRARESAKVEAETKKIEQDALTAAHDEARALVEQAREQAEITWRDHDERLTAEILKITYRSCADPSSVSQSELDSLPQLHKNDFFLSQPVPLVRDGCMDVYRYLCGGNRDAEEIKKLATPPQQPADIWSKPPQHGQQPAPVRAALPPDFSNLLPVARDLAITACNSPSQITIDKILTTPSYLLSFSEDQDNRTIASLYSGLGSCEGQVFQRLIETIRRGEGEGMSAQWVQNLAAPYRYAPPPNYTPPQNPGRRCEDYGNIRCP